MPLVAVGLSARNADWKTAVAATGVGDEAAGLVEEEAGVGDGDASATGVRVGRGVTVEEVRCGALHADSSSNRMTHRVSGR
ncbi:MAG: hypothetical protein HY319_21585 [Armatimonadetes bacterium]|nr:hypothetical protein [Armatimonadota bacterium]